MGVIDLRKYSGLSISFDGSEIVPQEGSIEQGDKSVVKISDMRSQLLNPDLSCPVIFYMYFSGIDRKSVFKRKNLLFNLMVMPQNLAGIEYVKTKGMRADSHAVLVEVVQGFTTLLMQTRVESGNEGQIRSFVVKLKRGEKYVIPPGFDFILVNTRQSTSIVALIHSTSVKVEDVFDDARGGANYIIRKNARQEIVQNPFYRMVTSEKPCKPDDLYKHFGLTAKTPVFKQILRKYDRFRWLHDMNKISWEEVPNCS